MDLGLALVSPIKFPAATLPEGSTEISYRQPVQLVTQSVPYSRVKNRLHTAYRDELIPN